MNTNRRALVKTFLGVGAFAALPASVLAQLGGVTAEEAPGTAVPVAGGPADGTPPVSESHGAPPWSLLDPLKEGAQLHLGWSVVSLSAVTGGACVLALRHEAGDEARVHVCRNGGAPRGVASTRDLDLILMNGGKGSRPTDESIGCVLLGLAIAVRRREDASPLPNPSVALLLTHEERLAASGGRIA